MGAASAAKQATQYMAPAAPVFAAKAAPTVGNTLRHTTCSIMPLSPTGHRACCIATSPPSMPFR
ncbi:hypothetical protein EJA05_27770 [Pseudomonas oryziphila]|uniref:Uncharacterized protein n=1 Tax=Pseudomonas entomophila TaxID=312306 RepID=A0A3Q8U4Y7_9PSED|nr:hypothetical protein EJA05_27770 [Pseudomonas oryziphila]